MKRVIIILAAFLAMLVIGALLYFFLAGESGGGEKEADILKAAIKAENEADLVILNAQLAELERQQLIASCKKSCGFLGIFSSKIRRCKDNCVKQYSTVDDVAKIIDNYG